MIGRLSMLLILAATFLVAPSSAWAACSSSAEATGNVMGVGAECESTPSSPHINNAGPGSSGGQSSPYTAFQWIANCQGGAGPHTGQDYCPTGGLQCGTNQSLHTLLGQLPNGTWVQVTTDCRPNNPQAPTPPQVTPALVLTAFQRIGIPTYSSVSQPAGKTLVNFDTIFHAQAEPFTASVTLLGQRVDLRIRPSSYRWEFGDGTTTTTESGGAAYPSKEIVHRYAKAHTTVEHRVVITWSATFRVNGGPERPVPGTVTRAGPVTSLRISEATPVLSGEGH